MKFNSVALLTVQAVSFPYFHNNVIQYGCDAIFRAETAKSPEIDRALNCSS